MQAASSTLLGAAICSVLVLTAAGCSGSAEEPSPAPPVAAPQPEEESPAVPKPPVPAPPAQPTFEEPTTANASAATCAVGPATAIGEAPGKRLRSLAAGFGPGGGLVAWPRSKSQIAVVPLDAGGSAAGEAVALEIPGARKLHGIEAVGDRFFVSTHDLCPDGKFFYKCLHGLTVDGAGRPLGAVVTEVTREWIRGELHQRIDRDEVWLLRSYMYVPPVINSLRRGDDGAAEIGFVAELGGGESLAWARAFEVREQRWLAIVEREEGKPALLSSESKPGTLHFLPEGARIHGLEWHRGGPSLLFAPVSTAGGRIGLPRVAHLSPAGKLVGQPQTIESGAPLPPPFAGQVEAELSKKGRDLVFQRQDAAGRSIGAQLTVAPFPAGSRDDPQLVLTWTGRQFLAVWSSFEDQVWKIRSAPIDCGGVPSAAH
jgi:hypothetical protein